MPRKKRQYVPKPKQPSLKDLAAAENTLEQTFPRASAVTCSAQAGTVSSNRQSVDQQTLQPQQGHSTTQPQPHQQLETDQTLQPLSAAAVQFLVAKAMGSMPATAMPAGHGAHIQMQPLAHSNQEPQVQYPKQRGQQQTSNQQPPADPVSSALTATACGELTPGSPALLPSIFSPLQDGAGGIFSPTFLQDLPSINTADAGGCTAGTTAAAAAAALAGGASYFGFDGLDDFSEDSLWSGDLGDLNELLEGSL